MKKTKPGIPVKKLTTMAALTAASLIIFIIESQIPLPIAIPGAKLGLANAVTLFALFYSKDGKHGAAGLTAADAFIILICRIILGAVFTGRLVSFIYSITGGLLAFAAQSIMKKIVTTKQIWACGAVGAVFHNIGQIAAAALIIGTPAIAAYLPALTIAGITTGTITGLIAQLTLKRIKETGA